MGHGEVVVDVEFEDGVVAVVAMVVRAPDTGGGGEGVVARAAGADALVEGGHFVEAAGASVHVVLAAAYVASMEFAEEGGIVELRGVGAHAHDIEVLSVGGGLVGVGGDFHACGAGLVPTGAVAYEVASPTGGIDAVADVGGESGGREVGVVEGVPKTVDQSRPLRLGWRRARSMPLPGTL